MNSSNHTKIFNQKKMQSMVSENQAILRMPSIQPSVKSSRSEHSS